MQKLCHYCCIKVIKLWEWIWSVLCECKWIMAHTCNSTCPGWMLLLFATRFAAYFRVGGWEWFFIDISLLSKFMIVCWTKYLWRLNPIKTEMFFFFFHFQWLNLLVLKPAFLELGQYRCYWGSGDITHWGLVTPYGDKDLGQDWLR